MTMQKLETTPTTTKNNYNGFQFNNLVPYGNYRQPLKLNSGASGHYVGPRKEIRNRQRKQNAIKAQVADGKNIDQVEEGKTPLARLMEGAVEVNIFPHMPNALMSCGKIFKTGHRIILDDPIATVVNILTNKEVMEAEFRHQKSTLNIYQDDPVVCGLS